MFGTKNELKAIKDHAELLEKRVKNLETRIYSHTEQLEGIRASLKELECHPKIGDKHGKAKKK